MYFVSNMKSYLVRIMNNSGTSLDQGSVMLFSIQRQLLGNADDGGRNSVNNDRCIEYPYGSRGAGLSVLDQRHVFGNIQHILEMAVDLQNP